MPLRHIHLPGRTSYLHAAKLQDRLVSAFLAHKAKPAQHPRPPPTVITAQFHPVYTCGRREVGTVSAEQRQYLTQPTPWGEAEFHEALRGGQTTFHGPGQLVAYPILDLKRYSLTPRCWVNMLESTVIATCGHYGVKAMRTENPGVWVSDQDKICALGVHLRRNITSHGVGLNVSTDLGWFKRIVACGLEGKGTTTLAREGVEPVPSIEKIGDVFVEKLALGLQGVDGTELVKNIEDQEALEEAYLPNADARILAVHGMGAPAVSAHKPDFVHHVPLTGEPGPSDWHRRVPSLGARGEKGGIAAAAQPVRDEHLSPTDISGAAAAPASIPECEKTVEETLETPVDSCEGVLEEDDGRRKRRRSLAKRVLNRFSGGRPIHERTSI
ncbi:hypothetical protein B0A55_04777 [Friedmanniomyces simplex]|uniref:lipoyl(octanoyl) transferase n=1 Tax=Friedmanniomyces simplex TaxID=329884 RepID=A0A4U0XPE9_9PEZI|nr:hypothetical protein B0A55_04777 [Friedmanniomyces simplex]